MTSCPTCQTPVAPKVRFCPACGAALPSDDNASPATSSTPADDAAMPSASAHTVGLADAEPGPTPAVVAATVATESRRIAARATATPEALPTANPTPHPARPPAPLPPTAAFSVVKAMQDDGVPLELLLFFPHTLVAGHGSRVRLQ